MKRIYRLIAEAFNVPMELWKERKPVQTPMYILGMLLFCSGIIHFIIWLFSGESWSGPVSWRKPTAFGLSAGITTVSLAWVIGLLPPRKALFPISWIYTIFMFLEVGLITMQKWRGLASHFNKATPLDALIFYVMGTLITLIAVLILTLAIWSFKELHARPEMSLAIRAGLIFLTIGNILGMILAGYGSYIMQASPGHLPNIFGQAGVMKLPHALALHAIQVLPFLAWLLNHTQRELISKLKIMKSAIAGYSGIQLFVLLQTFTGHAPHDVTLGSAMLAFVSVLILAAAFFVALISKDTASDSIQKREVR